MLVNLASYIHRHLDQSLLYKQYWDYLTFAYRRNDVITVRTGLTKPSLAEGLTTEGEATALGRMYYRGDWIRADVKRLPSHIDAYVAQYHYHHKTKAQTVRAWRGLYPNGNYTDYIIIPHSEYGHWDDRIKEGESAAELQVASEYTMRINSGNTESVLRYLHTLDRAAKISAV